jgi:5-methylcytosine-specific restriction endonuclease McrA
MKRKRQIVDLFEKQAGKCAYCHKDMTLSLGRDNTATKDHVIPKSKFRISDEFNLVAACNKCNSLKSDMPLAHFMGFILARR